MLALNKNQKDSSYDLDLSIKDTGVSIPLAKVNKLITALYMVTDIIDKDEPLRGKLRTLGLGIISDIGLRPGYASGKINQILSFLGIASAMNIISEMNCNILKKEFSELDQSIQENVGGTEVAKREISLTEFFSSKERSKESGYQSIGHRSSARIGVQKGSTLMQALSDKNLLDIGRGSPAKASDFDVLKKERRDNINTIIKNIGGNATIKDIMNKMNEGLSAGRGGVSFSEKTLQRELMSMTKDGVLNKEGSKRWTHYSIKAQA